MPTRHPVYGAGSSPIGYTRAEETDDELRARLTRQREGTPLQLASEYAYRERLYGFRDQYGTPHMPATWSGNPPAPVTDEFRAMVQEYLNPGRLQHGQRTILNPDGTIAAYITDIGLLGIHGGPMHISVMRPLPDGTHSAMETYNFVRPSSVSYDIVHQETFTPMNSSSFSDLTPRDTPSSASPTGFNRTPPPNSSTYRNTFIQADFTLMPRGLRVDEREREWARRFQETLTRTFSDELAHTNYGMSLDRMLKSPRS